MLTGGREGRIKTLVDHVGAVIDKNSGWVEMKRVSMLLFLAGSFAYPQNQPIPVAAEKFTFQKRLQWYAKTTYTEPMRLVWLVGEVTADDFVFNGIEKWGSGLSGWGKSLAAVYGQRVIANTTELFVGQLIGDDARYKPSGKKGVTRRTWGSPREFVKTFKYRGFSEMAFGGTLGG